MCGIVGYVGFKEASPFLIRGLQQLEYRGYDSAGIATLCPSEPIRITKVTGRVSELSRLVEQAAPKSTIGIGHTRWATHGAATTANAHPHVGGTGQLTLVHNGVIENYESLKSVLISKGYQFRSQTDTEVVAHLIVDRLKDITQQSSEVTIQHCVEAVQEAILQLRTVCWLCSGTFPIC
jgi:glutamine---fructose-6-phosphate transaminase (isomerizing)